MKILISGSLAYDTIMVFEDRFKNHILPDQTHMLNVSFMTPQMRRYQGGCAGNIAYNLKMLGGEPVIMATVGQDFGPYQTWLEQRDFVMDHIKVIEDEFTAQAFVTTDIDNNQITAFHPGAMSNAHLNSVADASDIKLGVVAPNGRDAMIQHAAQFVNLGVPFVFDPGQGMPMFSGEELLTFVEQASYAIFNDYESQMMIDKTGKSLDELKSLVDTLIVTRGGEGSDIYSKGEVTHIPAAPIAEAVDPTGCGDAYRGGLLYGMSQNLNWQDCGRIASLCGAIKVEQSGTQSHIIELDEFAKRYQVAFDAQYPLAV